MIEIIDLNKSFDNQPVLKGINLKVEHGEILALIGGSGKGKSVLIKHIIGLLRPDRGQVLIDQKNIWQVHGKELRALKDRLGVVFQGSALFDSLTVFENIAFPLKEKTKLSTAEIRQKVLSELAHLGLTGSENKFPSQLSGGMRKRVALARCLVMNPEIMLFDEPTTGLDPLIMKSIHKLIRNLQKQRNLTAFIVSHEIPEIFDIADKVAMLHDGQIISVGTPQEIKNSSHPVIQQFLYGELD